MAEPDQRDLGQHAMRRRDFLRTAALGIASWTLPGCMGRSPRLARSGAREKPNFIVVLTDDQGYEDVGCFGSPDIATPNLDRMAAEGRRFTDFYAAAPVCTPSRAALITGCYPARVSLPNVLNHRSNIGINSEEITIAEILKERGYATACYGKWHLGCQPEFLPTRHGFDDYFGLPYSNDMWPNHPSDKSYPPLPLIEGEEVVATQPDQTQLTTWYTEHAVRFIEQNRDRPFFLYVPHSMPHVPLFVSDKFKGKSPRGLYGDVIMEIDWSVGEILSTLKRLGIDRDTLVVFSSDNGPWLSYGDHAGSAGPLREGKGTTFDGGQREPCIVWGPGRVPDGTVCREPCAMFDLLPTFARLAGGEAPTDRVIDGKDIWPLMAGAPGTQSPHEAFYYFRGTALEAVRAGNWKLHLSHAYRSLAEPGTGGMPGRYVQKSIEKALFNLSQDLGEQHDVSSEYPGMVERLAGMARDFARDLEENRRPPGRAKR